MRCFKDSKRFETNATAVATITLGYLNARSFMHHEGAFAGPQTGNLIKIGISIGQGDFSFPSGELAVLLGFVAGCILGSTFVEHRTLSRTYLIEPWLSYSALLLVVAVLDCCSLTVARAALGNVAGGLALTAFRSLGAGEVNDAIQTGNLKNVIGGVTENFIAWLRKGVRQSWASTGRCAAAVILFFCGVIAGSFADTALPDAAPWLPPLMCVLLPLFSTIDGKRK